MSDMPVPTERIREEAAQAAETAADLRRTVRDMTLHALKSRALDLAQLRQVLGAVTEGLSVGLERRGGELRSAAAEALAGLDDALRKSAEATKLAAEQLLGEGRALAAEDIKPILDDLRRLEEEFLDAVSRSAERAGARVKQALGDLVIHARRAGTDTGRAVADILESLGNRALPEVRAGLAQGAAAGGEVARRLALAASGLLAGMAEVLQEKADKSGKGG